MAAVAGCRRRRPRKKAIELLSLIGDGSGRDAGREQQQEAGWHALSGLLAYAGHDAMPTQSEDDAAIYRIVGAGLVWELMQTMRALAGFVGGPKK